ncbi:MAG TPA: alpha/beta hydrolase [Terracidiphilus sp.]|nr:alpha/beta hydrolase [Terracidiphilus sp.]
MGPATATMGGGGSQAFTANVANDSSNAGVSWSIGAGAGTLNSSTTSSVTYNAPAAISANAAVTLTATSIADASATATAQISLAAPVVPTITSVAVACIPTSVDTGQTSQCTPTVTGTGSYSSAVTWTVDGVTGGNSTDGTISASGLYTSPAVVPAPNTVTVAATSVADATKSGSTTVTVTGTVETATQQITAASGGTITLPSGSSVTIPAGALAADSTLTLTLTTGLQTEPPSGFILGEGDALVLTTATPPFNTLTGTLAFVIDSGANTTGLTGSSGLADLIDSTGDNFFGVPGTYDPSANVGTIPVSAALMTGTNSVVVSMNNLEPLYYSANGVAGVEARGSATATGDASEPPSPGQLSWNPGSGTWTPYAGCPASPDQRILVLVHGMASSVENAFGNNGKMVTIDNGTPDYCVNQIVNQAGTNGSGNPTYGQVVGFDYDWTDAQAGGASFANFLNQLAQCPDHNQIDIEAHSEGGPTAASGILQASPATQALIANFVGLGNPWTGTAAAVAATQPQTYIPLTTVLMSLSPFLAPIVAPSVYQGSVSFQGHTLQALMAAPFTSQLQPDSSFLNGILGGLGTAAPNLKMTMACGNSPNVLDGTRVIQAITRLFGEANDGIVGESSCKGMGPGGNAFTGLTPYALPTYSLSHVQLACDPNVIKAVGLQIQNPLNPAGPALIASPTSIPFPSEQQGGTPPSQGLSITSSGSALAWTATLSSGASSWLSIDPGSGTTPSTPTVSASVSNAGTYSATISITAVGASNRLSIPVSLTVTPAVTAENLTLSTAGTGSGSISPNPVGSTCGTLCYTYDSDISVDVTESAASGSTFTGWSGDCASNGACSVLMTANKSVTANFTANTTGGGITGTWSGNMTEAGGGCDFSGTMSWILTQTGSALSGSLAYSGNLTSGDPTVCGSSTSVNDTFTGSISGSTITLTGAQTETMSATVSGSVITGTMFYAAQGYNITWNYTLNKQ